MNDKMQPLHRLLKNIGIIGQICSAAITPPLVLIFLAHLLISRCGWGLWTMVAAIVLGVICSFSTVRSVCKKFFSQKQDDVPPAFNDHQ